MVGSLFLLMTISALNRFSFASSAPTFVPAYNLSNDSGTAKLPNVQNNGSNVYVSWTESAKGIYFRSSPDNGTTWNPPLTKSALKLSNKGGVANYPLVAQYGPNVYVVWSQTPGSGQLAQIYISISSNYGLSFTTATLVSSNPSGSQITPVIAAYGNDVYVAWTAKSASYLVSSSNNGASWGSVLSLSSQHEPQLAASGSYAYATADGGVIYVSSNNGTTWKRVYISGCCGSEPWIMASGSNVVLTWETKSNTSTIYAASSQNFGQTWTRTVTLSSSVPDSWAPMLGVQGNTAIVAWRSNPGGSLSQEYVSTTTNGGINWSNSTAIGIASRDNEWPFTVTLSGNNAFIMWSEKIQSNSNSSNWQTLVVYSSENGTTWSAPLSLTNSPASGAQPEQDIATGSISSFGSHGFAVWGNNSTKSQIYFSSS